MNLAINLAKGLGPASAGLTGQTRMEDSCANVVLNP